jgi:integrase
MMLMTAVLTGMTEGELLGLKWEDFDWLLGQVVVCRTRENGKTNRIVGSNAVRRIDLDSALVASLRRWNMKNHAKPSGAVFETRSDEADRGGSSFRDRLKSALAQTGLAELEFEDLRHTYAFWRIRQGRDIKYIQKQLGHDSIQLTTEMYGNLGADRAQ